MTRILMSRLLTRLGCVVYTAENGQVALDILLAPPPTTPSTMDRGPALGLSGFHFGPPEDEADSLRPPHTFDLILLDNQMVGSLRAVVLFAHSLFSASHVWPRRRERTTSCRAQGPLCRCHRQRSFGRSARVPRRWCAKGPDKAGAREKPEGDAGARSGATTTTSPVSSSATAATTSWAATTMTMLTLLRTLIPGSRRSHFLHLHICTGTSNHPSTNYRISLTLDPIVSITLYQTPSLTTGIYIEAYLVHRSHLDRGFASEPRVRKQGGD